jgi:hypothetical protein
MSITDSKVYSCGSICARANVSATDYSVVRTTIRGSGAGSNAVELHADSFRVELVGVWGSGDRAIFAVGSNGVILRSQASGSVGSGAVVTGSNVIVEDSQFTKNGEHGLQIAGGTGAVVRRNVFNGNGGAGSFSGLDVGGGAGLGTITLNAAAGNDVGISGFSPTTSYYSNSAKGNTVDFDIPIGDVGPISTAAGSGPATNNIDP